MRIATRIWLPTVVFTVVIAFTATGVALRTRSALVDTDTRLVAQQAKLDDAFAWNGLTHTNAVRTQAILTAADPALEPALKADIEATSKRISEIQQRIAGRVAGADEQTLLDRIDGARKSYIAARDAARKLKAGGSADDAKAAWTAKVQPLLNAYLESQRAYVEFQQANSASLRARIATERMNTVWAVSALLAVFAVAMAIGARFTARSVCRPLAGLANTARRIGEGDLAVQIDAARGDEVGEVYRALAQMRDALRGIVSQVREAADSIQTASAEVASGNADLSHRTEQAASNLQQTAGSLEQLTGNVGQSAEAAAQANQLAASASTVAVRGGEVVAQVVSTMGEIDTASKRIADIISTIDGIAFQTNILALNAAVEAARAGEQGRGFAVVAGEVRMLAQRSAEAAREIKGLIHASVERVETGTSLVGSAGATMTEIVASVQRVTDVIGEITAATSEQRQSIGSVNGAVAQLDQMTQQNAALVEQSAAAAESLREQARKLSDSMRVFRLEAESVSATPESRMKPLPAHVVARPSPAPLTPATKPEPAKPAAARPAPPAPKAAAAPATATPVAAGADEWESF